MCGMLGKEVAGGNDEPLSSARFHLPAFALVSQDRVNPHVSGAVKVCKSPVESSESCCPMRPQGCLFPNRHNS